MRLSVIRDSKPKIHTEIGGKERRENNEWTMDKACGHCLCFPLIADYPFPFPIQAIIIQFGQYSFKLLSTNSSTTNIDQIST